MTRRAPPASASAPVDAASAGLDLGQLALHVGQAVAARVQDALARRGMGELRAAHVNVFPHLVAAPRAIGDLAARLGVSPQATSKVVAELEALGYLARVGSPDDKRVSVIGLTPRGRAAVQTIRQARAALEAKLAAAHGERAVAQARTLLTAAASALAGTRARRPD